MAGQEQQEAGGGIAKCPFSGRPIGITQLFTSEIEIEHILPRSRTLDDSAANKILCFRDMNRIKRGKTPFEAFGNTPTWGDITARAERLPANKRWRFKADALEKFGAEADFLSRQLNETKYLSRLAKAYTKGHLQRPTCAHSRMPIDLMTSGSATSLFQASQIAPMMSS